MNYGIKLSARLALNGSQMKILPLLTVIMFSVFLFSLCNAVFTLFPQTERMLPILSLATLVVFVFVTSQARYRLEIRHLMLAKGIRKAGDKPRFSGVIKSCVLYTVLFCLKTLWLLFFELVPITATVLFYFYNLENPISRKAAVVIASGIVVLAISGVGFYSVFVQRYSKSAFFLACYEDFSVFDAIGESVRKTRNSLLKILLFKLGFLPWFLLCAGIVPVLFVIPYYKQCLTIRFLKSN